MGGNFTPSLRRDIGKEIAVYGLRRNFGTRVRPPMLALIGVLIVSIAVLAKPEYAGLVLSVTVFFYGFLQWAAARDEASMDKFYERLDLSNKKLEGWPAAREMLTTAWAIEATFQKEMYVYVELDTLEYVVEKYRLGYMSAEHTLRGLENFKARCHYSPDFKKLALESGRTSSYSPYTIRVVEKICKDLDSAASPAAPQTPQALPAS